MKRTLMLLMLIGLLLFGGSALAMSSTHYRLDWSTGMTGGGGLASSAHYAVHFTIGQAAIGASTSTNYGVGLGYWYGVAEGYKVYLPLILK